jgi:hypothetical protein
MVAMLCVVELLYGRFLPNSRHALGHDYEYFLPRLLAGEFFVRQNGVLAVPWFIPFACGGLPAFANPQDLWFSVPQWLAFVMNPLAAVHVTLLLFAGAGLIGTYALLRKRFLASVPAALTGALLFGLNGFFGYRMAIGHLTAHAFMLLPVIVLLLAGPRSSADAVRTLCAGLLLGYLVLTSAQFLPPFACALAALCVLRMLVAGDRDALPVRAAGASAVALCLSAARISAVLHFLSQFPRSDYPVAGFPSIVGSVGTALQLLFVGPLPAPTTARLVHGYWAIERHELEYGITIVPAIIFVVAGFFCVRRMSGVGSTRPRPWGLIASLSLLLLLPVVANYYQPSWNAALKSLPLIGSTSTFLRWMCVYIPVAIVGAVLLVDRATTSLRARWMVFAAAAIAAPMIVAGENVSFYQRQTFDPRDLIAAHTQLRRTGQVPPVDHVAGYDPASLAHCATSAVCYEPIFGYRLEHFPGVPVSPGPITTAGDTLNLRNPACYVFPAENGCRPGANFSRNQQAQAAAFLQYRAFTFAEPLSQRVANWLSVLTLIGSVATLTMLAVRAGHTVQRPETKPS